MDERCAKTGIRCASNRRKRAGKEAIPAHLSIATAQRPAAATRRRPPASPPPLRPQAQASQSVAARVGGHTTGG